MEWIFDETQKHFQKIVREFANVHVKPMAREIDELEQFPLATLEAMKKELLMGIPFSGLNERIDGDFISYIIAINEISKVCASSGVILSTHTSLASSPIDTFGDLFQKEEYLAKLAVGEYLGAFGITEPNAGSDISSMSTTADKVDGGYILNGTKVFITNAGYADLYIIFAVTDKSSKSKRISAFIVKSDFKGFEVSKKYSKMGIRGSVTGEILLKDCFVPDKNLLGKEGDGLKIALHTLDGGRIAIAAQALGIAEGALEETIKYVKSREQFGKSVAFFQNTQFTLADMYVKIEAAKSLVYKAAKFKAENLNYTKEASVAKLYASSVAMEVTTNAVQLFGGCGYTKDYPVERMMRDAKITQIYEGTSEVQKMVIASNILKSEK